MGIHPFAPMFWLSMPILLHSRYCWDLGGASNEIPLTFPKSSWWGSCIFFSQAWLTLPFFPPLYLLCVSYMCILHPKPLFVLQESTLICKKHVQLPLSTCTLGMGGLIFWFPLSTNAWFYFFFPFLLLYWQMLDSTFSFLFFYMKHELRGFSNHSLP